MMQNLLRNLSLNWGRNGNFLKPSASPLFISKKIQYSVDSGFIEQWIDTLPEDKQKRVKLIQNEIALKKTQSVKVPHLESMDVDDFEELLEMSSHRRQRYYNYLYAVKSAEANDDVKKQIRNTIYAERKELGLLNSKSNHIDYGLGKNSLIMKLHRKTMMTWRNHKLFRAMVANEPPLIFDCGFCDTMSKYEIKDTARQLKYAFSNNRLTKRPFVMHICNMDNNSLLYHEFREQCKNLEKWPIIMHSEDVAEVFPKEKIVYLSPDAEEEMQDFNKNDVHVVGAIVDKRQQMPLTVAKAKRLEVRAVRLPLQKYVRFHSHKTLTLDQMTNILLEMKSTQDWKKAFKHVPGRKIFS